ncbi:DNA-processing protein DprA [Leptodesmis sp.]|uniref:DNA-processing protein DprA n=1 Tax=Leptodesmis sp. TaxID=3100501 RepID=UPI0040534633
MIKERAFWLAWSQINGIGPVLLKRLQTHFKSLVAAWEASSADLMEVEGFGYQTAEMVVAERRAIQPEQLLNQHEQENPNFWTPADPDYPRLLLEIPDPPPVLYYQGKVEERELNGLAPMIAIVGTRSPSPYGRQWTRRLTIALVEQGFTIVSGLAEGIDTEAHRSCLEAGGRTIAVLGCAVNVVYPWSNRSLYQQLVQTGLALSEHPAGTQPNRTFFPRRNRIIAGLCRAVLVMEAPEKSGGLITAYYANEYGRDVYALPGRLDDYKSLGCLKLIDQGARPIRGTDHLLELLGTIPQFKEPPGVSTQQFSLPLNLSSDLAHILQVLTDLAPSLDGEAVPFDLLVQHSGLPAGSVSSALTQLEMEELITSLPGMRYQRS